jgi:2-methylisocitrate lyase-like PEP mutase family enzyme
MAKTSAFRALHMQESAFIIPNPWDAGTARILAALGFKALATTSAGMAFSLGRGDGQVSWDAVLAHCRTIVAATDLPVSADLEKGIGDTPESAAATIRAAAEIGLAGCSLEDYTGDDNQPIFDFNLAVERIQAAVEARDALPADFVLTARAENLIRGRNDLDDTIKRLQAFDKAGADVLYAPGLRDLDSIRTVCAAVTKPVNVLALSDQFSLAELSDAGAKRISVGGGLARVAYGAFINASRDIAERDRFAYTKGLIAGAEIERLLQ